MAYSNIQFRGKSCEIRDTRIALVVYATVAEVADRDVRPSENLKGLLQVWSDVIDQCGPGCIDLQFDRFVKESKDRDELISIISASRDRLLSHGDTINLSDIRARAIIQSIDLPESLPKHTVQAAFDAILSVLCDCSAGES